MRQGQRGRRDPTLAISRTVAAPDSEHAPQRSPSEPDAKWDYI